VPDPTPAQRAVDAIAGQLATDTRPDAPHAVHSERYAARIDMVQKAAGRRTTRASGPAFDEIGTTGLRHYGGFVVEEWMAKLAGKRGAMAYREMADNDPVVGAILFAIEMLARGVEWNVEPGADPQAAELVQTCMDDMSHTWADFVSEVFTMLVYGWDLQEIVYKRRLGQDPGNGPDDKPLPSSRYEDGLIGWRKLVTRAQETLEQWVFAEDGGIEAMVQVAYDGVRRTVPMEKALLFRTTTKRNNPEGRSILRPAFIPQFRKKNIEEIEAIGVERDVAGIPVATPPDDFIWDETNPVSRAIIDAAKDMVTSIRRDEDEGVVLPPGWKLELLSSGGSHALDTDKIIRRYDGRIAIVVLADFILMAQDKVGSYGLGKAKIDTFGQAMQAWLKSVAEVLNRYAIPRLLKLNGLPLQDPPQLVPGDVGELDLAQVGQFLQQMHLAGYEIDWAQPLLEQLFKLAGLTPPEEDSEQAARGNRPGNGPYDAGLEDVPEGEVEGVPAASAGRGV
jgi:hypothetical protein